MAYYNANRVIKLTRKALGLTQEKLSEGICEVETYSRIESGRRTIRRSTYQKLMEKMGRITDRRYAVCVSKDGMLLDEKVEYERAFNRYDYEAAEMYLKRMQEYADNNPLTTQYIARAEVLVDYRKGRISAKDLVSRLEAVMRITVPCYEYYVNENKVFPFVKEELQTLMSLGNAYRRNKQMPKSLQMYEYILRCMDEKYLGEPDATAFQITVLNSISRAYEEIGENGKAIERIEKALELAAQRDYGSFMPILLSANAYNVMKMAAKEEHGKKSVVKIKRLSRQAYYIALARGDYKSVNNIKRFYKNILQNEDDVL